MNGPDLLMPAPVRAAPLAEMRNHTTFESQYFQMMDTDDEVFHVIASRVTYDLNRLDEHGIPQLAARQGPLLDADQFMATPPPAVASKKATSHLTSPNATFFW